MTTDCTGHVPVFLSEVVALMNVDPGSCYIDATFGRGGHSRALLAELNPNGRLLVIDRDLEAIDEAEGLATADRRLAAFHGAFADLLGSFDHLKGQVAGILLDLGVSSPQLDDPDRGFSFRSEGPLDMRMDTSSQRTAADWLEEAPEEEIADVLWLYGEERRSRQIARRIVTSRAAHPIRTTQDFATVVRSCVSRGKSRIDPATRSFQAVRIFINDEIGQLERGLKAALGLLRVGGRLLVISFHSLEDRLVKHHFRELALDAKKAAQRLDLALNPPFFNVLTRRPIMADGAAIAHNPRARSARLRAVERIR